MPFNLSASSEEKTTFPLAAPGDAGKPLAITLMLLFSSNVGCSKVSNELGSILRTASFFEINFSLTISTAILTADFEVLFPDLVCNIHNFLFSTVNSTSCISLKYFSKVCRIFFSFLKTSGIASSIDNSFTPAFILAFFVIYCGVLVPATTSSP